MFLREPERCVGHVDCEAVFRDCPKSGIPGRAVRELFDRNGADARQSDQRPMLRNACLLKCLTGSGTFWRLHIFAAAGDPLPDIEVGAPKERVLNATARVTTVGKH